MAQLAEVALTASGENEVTRLQWLRGSGAWAIGGPVVAILVWELLARSGLEERHILPAPSSVLSSLVESSDALRSNIAATVTTAALGFAWGVAFALLFGLICAVSRMVEAFVVRSAIVIHSLPTIALAPILLVVSSGRTPGVVMAAISTFFLTLMNFVAGLRETPDVALEMNHAFGGSQAKALWKVRLPFAIPSLFAGFMISAPIALVGALVSEFLIMGNGLGAALMAAQESLNAPLVWAISLVCALVSTFAYLVFGVLGTMVSPWRTERTTEYRVSPVTGRSRVSVVVGGFVSGVVTIGVLLLMWAGLIRLFNLDNYFAKGPLDVARYYASGEAWGPDSHMMGALGSTVTKAVLGLLIGTVVALIIAGAVVLSERFALAVMPTLVTFRAIPVLALIPVVSLIARDGYLTAILIAAFLSFFITVVNVVDAARGVPRDLLDLGAAYNIGALRLRWGVHRPFATPALFTSLKVTAPLSVIGAMSAEWLVAGDGMGHLMIISGMQGRFTEMWAGFVLLSAVSIVIYVAVAVVERRAIRRLS